MLPSDFRIGGASGKRTTPRSARLPARWALLQEGARAFRVVFALLDDLEIASRDLLGLLDRKTEASEDRELRTPDREGAFWQRRVASSLSPAA